LRQGQNRKKDPDFQRHSCQSEWEDGKIGERDFGRISHLTTEAKAESEIKISFCFALMDECVENVEENQTVKSDSSRLENDLF
jgi:hypothetical protein